MLSLEEAKKLADQGNVIPLVREFLADMETPVSVYNKISSGAVSAFLLESVEGGERLARYSFLGMDPFLTFKSCGKVVTLSGREEKKIEGDPVEILKTCVNRYKPVALPGLPPFTGGAVGYFGYDTIRLFEKLPDNAKNDLNIPEMFFCFYDTVIAFDNRQHKILVISNLIIEEGVPIEKEYMRSVFRIESIEQKLKSVYLRPFKKATRAEGPKSNFEKEAFRKVVEKCKDYIRAGDIFQVVPSQRFEISTDADPFDIYRMLRIINPSPYNFFLKLDDIFLIGSSPEVLVRVTGRDVITRPLAGTRKRGKSPEEDAALEKELLADEKERAEHLMLVDLGRNDLGRVCEYGSVRPEEFMVVEYYSHVMHISSTVVGTLRKDKDRFDALFSCLPAGTLSGAPKIRAMEIIDEMEPTRRLTYGGAVGYIDFTGNLDTCITIRTILMMGDRAFVQAGAGIVADSDPESEYVETQNKAKALFRAIEMVKEYEG
jgi:anthranilate synthase component 1